MRANSAGADEVEAEIGGFVLCFVVEVVENFHVVGNEADGDNHHVGSAGASPSRIRGDFGEGVADVGAEPGLGGGAAAALIDEPPVGLAKCLGNQPRGFAELGFVLAVLGHGQRDAVGGEEQVRDFAAAGRNLGERVSGALDHGFDKAWVVEKRAQLIDRWGIVADGLLSGGDVLAILPATGIAAEGGGEKSDGPADAVGFHLLQRIG